MPTGSLLMNAVCSLRVTDGVAVTSKVNQQGISPGKALHKDWRAVVTSLPLRARYTYGLALVCEEELVSAFLKVINTSTWHVEVLQSCTYTGIMDTPVYVNILQQTLLPFIRSVYPDSHRFM